MQRRPAPLAAAAAAVMLILAIPVLSLRLGSSDAANDPAASFEAQRECLRNAAAREFVLAEVI